MRPPKTQLSEALRNLNTIAPRGMPAILGDALKEEFQRHHARRKQKRIAQLSLLAACTAALAVLPMIFRHRPEDKITVAAPSRIFAPSPQFSAESAEPGMPQPKIKRARPHASPRKNAMPPDDRFVALPTFDPAIPIERLQMVRINLPGRDLRLVGFSVSEEIADRRVVADILIAQDGTPYALRFVPSSQIKENKP